MILFGNKKVTVFNRHFDVLTEEEIWLPTLLTNVNLTVTKGANITKSGMNDADTAKLYTDYDCCVKPYVRQKEWNLLTLTAKQASYTFTEGQDFFVEGDLTGIQVLDEGFFEWAQKHYDNVFRVTTVDAYRDIMEHLEIGGK